MKCSALSEMREKWIPVLSTRMTKISGELKAVCSMVYKGFGENHFELFNLEPLNKKCNNHRAADAIDNACLCAARRQGQLTMKKQKSFRAIENCVGISFLFSVIASESVAISKGEINDNGIITDLLPQILIMTEGKNTSFVIFDVLNKRNEKR